MILVQLLGPIDRPDLRRPPPLPATPSRRAV